MNSTILRGDGKDPHTMLMLFCPPPEHKAVLGLFDLTSSLLNQLGYAPNYVGFNRGKRYGRYKRITARELTKIKQQDVTSFALAYVPLPETNPIACNWLEGQIHSDGFSLSGRADLLLPTSEVIIPLVLEARRHLSITYGFQYVIDAFYSPAFHANGIIYHQPNRKGPPPLPESEEDRMAAWMNHRKELMPLGHMRDVFPLNLLTEIHRKRSFEGMPLFDWIGKSRSRGRLEQITTGLWAWHVPEEKCDTLGNSFDAAGMLTSGEKSFEIACAEDIRSRGSNHKGRM